MCILIADASPGVIPVYGQEMIVGAPRGFHDLATDYGADVYATLLLACRRPAGDGSATGSIGIAHLGEVHRVADASDSLRDGNHWLQRLNAEVHPAWKCEPDGTFRVSMDWVPPQEVQAALLEEGIDLAQGVSASVLRLRDTDFPERADHRRPTGPMADFSVWPDSDVVQSIPASATPFVEVCVTGIPLPETLTYFVLRVRFETNAGVNRERGSGALCFQVEGPDGLLGRFASLERLSGAVRRQFSSRARRIQDSWRPLQYEILVAGDGFSHTEAQLLTGDGVLRTSNGRVPVRGRTGREGGSPRPVGPPATKDTTSLPARVFVLTPPRQNFRLVLKGYGESALDEEQERLPDREVVQYRLRVRGEDFPAATREDLGDEGWSASWITSTAAQDFCSALRLLLPPLFADARLPDRARVRVVGRRLHNCTVNMLRANLLASTLACIAEAGAPARLLRIDTALGDFALDLQPMAEDWPRQVSVRLRPNVRFPIGTLVRQTLALSPRLTAQAVRWFEPAPLQDREGILIGRR